MLFDLARLCGLVLAAALVVAACSSDSAPSRPVSALAVTPDAVAPPASTPTPDDVASPTSTPTPDEVAPPALTPTPDDTVESDGPTDGGKEVIEVDVTGTDVVGGGRQTIELGEDVILRVTADRVDHVHVHGYDLFGDLAPGEPADLTFTADLPGVWEVELEDTGVLLLELEVR